MRVIEVRPGQAVLPEESVICHDLRNPAQRSDVLARKGTRLGAEDLAALLERGATAVHLAIPQAGDLGEDAAAARLGEAVAGAGVRVGRSHFGQVSLTSETRGLLRVRRDRLDQANSQPGVLIATSPPDCAADEGATLAIVKCAPLLMPESVIQQVEMGGVVIEVEAFQPRRVAFVAPGPRLGEAAFLRATSALTRAVEWYGSSLQPLIRTQLSSGDLARGFEQAVTSGAELILAAGAAATDPLDVLFDGLRQAGGAVEQIGIPAEPGTACWIGALAGRPVLGLASCELFGRPGALDLVLPRVFVGERLDPDLLRRIALGGLLTGGPSRILPYHETAGL
jgi:molybdenum cofactor cytidylyltransferase